MFLALLLACASSDTTAEAAGCVREDDPPGDPIYRSCAITGEGPGSAVTTWRTDAAGRTIAYDTNAGAWERAYTTDGTCETSTTETCTRPDGSSCGEWVYTRACDAQGNPTSVTTDATEADGDHFVHTVDYVYTYDADGRVIEKVESVRGADTPPVTTVCTWNEAEGSRTCVRNPTSDDAVLDDVTTTWTYDLDGLTVAWETRCQNPGYYEEQSWLRDGRGRTVLLESYASYSWEEGELFYTYDDRVLDAVRLTTRTGTDLTTTYRYARVDE